MTDDLDSCLPQDIRDRSIRSGSEYALLLRDALAAISCANERGIAVLGVESFLAKLDGLLVCSYSGYQFSFDTKDWSSFVKANNVQAVKFLEEQVDREELHFILAATSRREYENLHSQRPSQSIEAPPGMPIGDDEEM
jgi:hypothetical protein